MENYLGMIMIHGHLYEIDADGKNLVNHYNKFKRTEIDYYLNQGWDNYAVACYNPGLERIYKWSDFDGAEYEREELKLVVIPRDFLSQSKLPTEENVRAWNLAYKQIEHLDDSDKEQLKACFFVDTELSNRLNGKLPTVKIDGVDYIVDVQNAEVRQKHNPDKKFHFPNKYSFYVEQLPYDTLKKEPVAITGQDMIAPDNLGYVEFPFLWELDPVGWAIDQGYKPTAILYEPLDKSVEDKIKVVSSQYSVSQKQVSTAGPTRAEKESPKIRAPKNKRKGKRL